MVGRGSWSWRKWTWCRKLGKFLNLGELRFTLRSQSSQTGWQCHIRRFHNRLMFRTPAREAAARCSKEHTATQQKQSMHPSHVMLRLIHFVWASQNLDKWTRRQWRPLSLYHCQSPVTATSCDNIRVRKWCIDTAFGIMLSLPATCQTHFEN